MENISFYAEATTNSARIKYTVEIRPILTSVCIPYMDAERCRCLCEVGCLNYSKKWSCPPFSPTFAEYALGYRQIFIFYMRTNMMQFSYIKNDYLKIKAANSILKSRADRYIRQLAAQHGRYISTGSCRICKPCKCKLGLSCVNPESMAYSLEALGVDVSGLVERCFHSPLQWYKQRCLPEYTSVVCGILTKDAITAEFYREVFLVFSTE